MRRRGDRDGRRVIRTHRRRDLMVAAALMIWVAILCTILFEKPPFSRSATASDTDSKAAAVTIEPTMIFRRDLLRASAEPAALQGVASVIDGDTLDIHDTRIRLFGIDAPERRQTCFDEAGARWRCGQAAALALTERIGRTAVTCATRDIDRYGRIVAVCHADGTDLNGWMVSQGHARAWTRYSLDYVREENAAKYLRRGLWAGEFINPWDWRRGWR